MKQAELISDCNAAKWPSMLFLDSEGDCWLAHWNRLFTELEHLRSPMWFHTDPHDRDGLLVYAYFQACEDKCMKLANCVGEERSRHQQKKTRKRTHSAKVVSRNVLLIQSPTMR